MLGAIATSFKLASATTDAGTVVAWQGYQSPLGPFIRAARFTPQGAALDGTGMVVDYSANAQRAVSLSRAYTMD